MKNISRLMAVFTLVGLFLLTTLIVPTSQVSAHDGEVHEQVAQASEENKPAETNSAGTYKYVAQAGDSYSLMARKAVQTYGITEKVNLSEAQIIAAETTLTKQAGSPQLSRGQGVEITQETVKSAVDNATKLTDKQQAAWNVYAQHANFNTNAVGQAS